MYSVNVVSKATGLSRAALIYYEKCGVIHPVKKENGYRGYSDQDMILLMRVAVLRNIGLSVEEIAAFFGEKQPKMAELVRKRKKWAEKKAQYYRYLAECIDRMTAPLPDEPQLVETPRYYIARSGVDDSYAGQYEEKQVQKLVRRLPFSVFIVVFDNSFLDAAVEQFKGRTFVGMEERYIEMLGIEKSEYVLIGGEKSLRCTLTYEDGKKRPEEIAAIGETLKRLGLRAKGTIYDVSEVLLTEEENHVGLYQYDVYIPVEKA